MRKPFLTILLIIWVVLIFAVIIWVRPVGSHAILSKYINVVPGDLINTFKDLSKENKFDLLHIRPWIYNFIAYIIPGFLLPSLTQKKRYIQLLTYCTVFSLSVNLIRCFLLRWGSFDIDDVILNIFGFSFGYGLFSIISCYANKRK